MFQSNRFHPIRAVFTLLVLLTTTLESMAGPDAWVTKTIVGWNGSSRYTFLRDSSLYTEGWDTVGQARFWREVITMTSDTCIINIASCRKPVERVSRSVWMNQTELEKICFKDSLSQLHCIAPTEQLYVTAGKREFYEVKKTLDDINQAIQVFRKHGCDPFYAQAILLIESPGKGAARSYVGARGPFQLMPAVARRFGLKVSKYHDDRLDMNKAGMAAARLINTGCVPYIRKFLDEKGIPYQEHDLWFRLLVLHAYHAGAGNVRCVINALDPKAGGLQLFEQIWQTTCGGFKNESQNYSQIALASLMNFDELIEQDGDTVFLVKGDRMLSRYSRAGMKPWEAYEFLQASLRAYEHDLIDDMIPYEYFIRQVGQIRKEFTHWASVITLASRDVILKPYPASEEHVSLLAGELSKRRRFDEAIKLLKLNLDMHPGSPALYDSLAKAYRKSGDQKMADLYAGKAQAAAALQPEDKPNE